MRFNSPSIRRPRSVWFIAGLCVLSMWLAAAPAAGTYTLSRGRSLLLGQGLQIPSIVYPNSGDPNISQWRSANFSTYNFWGWSNPNSLGSLPTGQQWSRAYDTKYLSTKYLTAVEYHYANSLVAYQYGDELTDLSDASRLSDMAATYAQWRQFYPNVLAYTNSQASQLTSTALANYMQATQPDMISFDRYPDYSFPNADRKLWYSAMQLYRTAGLAGNDGTGTTPIPYHQFLSLYRDTYTSALPSESYVRLQQNASWAFGYTAATAFTYNGVPGPTGVGFAAAMFNSEGDTAPNAVFDYVKETNRQSRNLGPALVRLVSSGIFMKPGSGSTVTGTGLSAWTAHAGNTTGYTDYITGITPTVSQGGATDTSYKDVLVGYFKPLLANNSNCTFVDGLHFMIVNGSASGTAAASAQWYHLTFDFTGSDFDSLVRLSRDTGDVELITLTPTGSLTYSLDLNLQGGTGDLFAFWDRSNGIATIPEPSTLMLLATGLVGSLFGYVWRKTRK